MAAKNDAGLHKEEFVLFKRIGRISELVHWVPPRDAAQNCSWDHPGWALQPHSSWLIVQESWVSRPGPCVSSWALVSPRRKWWVPEVRVNLAREEGWWSEGGGLCAVQLSLVGELVSENVSFKWFYFRNTSGCSNFWGNILIRDWTFTSTQNISLHMLQHGWTLKTLC